MTEAEPRCRCCGATAIPAGRKTGRFVKQAFHLAKCPQCGFGFVVDFLTDLGAIYDEAYYQGRGADPLVDYVGELERPDTSIRRYEWRGILKAVEALRGSVDGLRWLDYGCGNGGLVRSVGASRQLDIRGFETGWIADRARSAGIPILSAAELAALDGSCDVVTAIEVAEHIPDPHELFQTIRRLLKPGGLFFLTTGNAAPVRDLQRWSYVVPEIHVSFFEPRTLDFLFERHGFRAEHRGFLPGHDDILRFKVLKNLGIGRVFAAERAAPWKLLSRLVDRRYRVTAHPVGWAI
jgi:SAM-dependent methyltransferase